MLLQETNNNTNNSHNMVEGVAENVFVIFLICISAYLVAATLFYNHVHSVAKLRVTDFVICLAAIILFLECCWFEAEIMLTSSSMTFCKVFTVINVTLATTIRTLIYVVLWLREEGIYNGPLGSTNPKAKIISKITLWGILFFSVLQILVLALIPQESEMGKCVSPPLPTALSVVLPLVFIFSSGFQLVLLGLTLYPVVKQMKGGIVTGRKKKLKDIATRLCICTAICTMVDLAFIVIVQIKPKEAPVTYIPICYAFNTVINTTTTLCSFVNYKLRLWPFRGKQRDQTPLSSGKNSFSSSSKNATKLLV